MASTTKTTSANGLSITTTHNDGTTLVGTDTDTKSFNSDGSTTETQTHASADGVVREETVTTVSADKNTVSVNYSSDGANPVTWTHSTYQHTAGYKMNVYTYRDSSGADVASAKVKVYDNG